MRNLKGNIFFIPSTHVKSFLAYCTVPIFLVKYNYKVLNNVSTHVTPSLTNTSLKFKSSEPIYYTLALYLLLF